MADEYVPTTQTIRERIQREYARSFDDVDGGALFDRWLAQHDQDVATKAWNKGCAAGLGMLRTDLSTWLTLALDGSMPTTTLDGDLLTLRDWIDGGVAGEMPLPEQPQAAQPDPLRARVEREADAMERLATFDEPSELAMTGFDYAVEDLAATFPTEFADWQATQVVDTLPIRAAAWVNAAALVDRLADDALAQGISVSRVNDLRFVAKVIRADAPKAYETKEDTHE